MLSYSEKIKEYVSAHSIEIVEMLKELVRIPSVRDEAMPGAPFGKECSDVLLCTEALYKKYGFETIGLYKKFFKINGEDRDAYLMQLVI